jgi:hypothetical protein
MGDLINCRDCGAKVSTDAKACPSCGSRKFRPKNLSILIIVVCLFSLGLINNITGSSQGEKLKNNKENTHIDNVVENNKISPIANTGDTIEILDENSLTDKPNSKAPDSSIKIKSRTKVEVIGIFSEKLPMWDVIWYKVRYKGKTAWVSEFNTNMNPGQPRFR